MPPCIVVFQWLKTSIITDAQACVFFLINTLRPRQNGRHFPEDLSKCIFLTENVWILIRISLKFVPKGPINNNPALVQMMAWRRPGDKPLSGPRMENLLTHICVTRPQWVNIHIHLAPGNPTLWCGIPIVSMQKVFWSSERNWKSMKKFLIPCKLCNYQFITYSYTHYSK